MTRILRPTTVCNAFTGRRCIFSDSSKFSCKSHLPGEAKSKSSHPSDLKRDMIGPPNQLSNLRPIAFHVPANESPLEKQFRLEREKVQRWNEDFWKKHNSAFIEGGNEFRQKKLGSSPDSEKKSLTAEEMSQFYKSFLDKNWKTHVSYNFEWYRKNFNLVMLALRVQLSKIGFPKS